MSHDSGRFLDHLYEMDDTEFEHVYDMDKRTACVRFGLEAYAIGYQDAFAGHEERNEYEGPENRRSYTDGYHAGFRKRADQLMAPVAREFGMPAIWT